MVTRSTDAAAHQRPQKAVAAQPFSAEEQAGTHHQAAEKGAERVPDPAAEQRTEEGGGRGVPQQHRGRTVAAAGGGQTAHPGPGLIQGRRGAAELPAQGVAGLQQFDIGAVGTDPPHPGRGTAILRLQADDQTAGDGEHLGVLPLIGTQQPVHGLLHPGDLRPALRQQAAQLRGQIQQLVRVHETPPSAPLRYAFSGKNARDILTKHRRCLTAPIDRERLYSYNGPGICPKTD